MRQYAKRRDANESDIIDALRAVGCSVLLMDQVDLVVGFRGRNYLLEVKDGNKSPSQQKLKPSQIKLRDTWRGQNAVVTSINEALAIIKGVI